MPQFVNCGHSYRNRLTIPNVGVFNIADGDIQVSRGVDSGKSLSLKLQSFTDTISAIRLEYKVSLYHLTKATYNSLKAFAQNDLLQNYLNNYTGSIDLNFSGESKNGCVIKNIQLGGGSAYIPTDNLGNEVEYIEKVDLIILAPSYEII